MPAGRPPMYETPEELQIKVDEYFEYVKGELKSVSVEKGVYDEQYNREPEKVTITGLTLYLGFCDRHSFYQYGEKEEFTHTIKKAHSRIEQHYENLIQGNNVAGPIFALKNLRWKDQTQSEVTLHTEQPLFPDVRPDDSDK